MLAEIDLVVCRDYSTSVECAGTARKSGGIEASVKGPSKCSPKG